MKVTHLFVLLMFLGTIVASFFVGKSQNKSKLIASDKEMIVRDTIYEKIETRVTDTLYLKPPPPPIEIRYKEVLHETPSPFDADTVSQSHVLGRTRKPLEDIPEIGID